MPFTVSVKPLLPAAAEAGLRVVTVGRGRVAFTVKVEADDFWPSGFAMTICAVPAAATSLAAMAALSCVGLV